MIFDELKEKSSRGKMKKTLEAAPARCFEE